MLGQEKYLYQKLKAINQNQIHVLTNQNEHVHIYNQFINLLKYKIQIILYIIIQNI